MLTPAHRRGTPICILAIAVLIALSAPALVAAAGPDCKHVEGKVLVSVDNSTPGQLQLSGPVIGGLAGSYTAAGYNFTPTGPNSTISFFTAMSYTAMKSGDVYNGESGTIDFRSGNVVALWNVLARSESLAGQLVVTGNLNLVLGTGELRYSGELCAIKWYSGAGS